MSPRFASITASLLARKGEARPWDAVLASEPVVPRDLQYRPITTTPPPVAIPDRDHRVSQPPTPNVSRSEPAVTPPPPSVIADKDRSCAVRMSAHDYERLGILAVKLSTTRQQLMKGALADMLVAKGQALACACLGACDRGCA
jgi:hypothetical protein